MDQFQQVNFFVKIQAASSVLRSSKIGFLELVKKYWTSEKILTVSGFKINSNEVSFLHFFSFLFYLFFTFLNLLSNFLVKLSVWIAFRHLKLCILLYTSYTLLINRLHLLFTKKRAIIFVLVLRFCTLDKRHSFNGSASV